MGCNRLQDVVGSLGVSCVVWVTKEAEIHEDAEKELSYAEGRIKQ